MTATLAIDYVLNGSAATRPVASILMLATEARGETFRTKTCCMYSCEAEVGWRVELYRPFSLLSFRKKEVFAQVYIKKGPIHFELTVFNSLLSYDETEKIRDSLAVLAQQFKGQRLV